MYNDQYFLRPIAIKPLDYPGGLVYKKFMDGLGTIAFRSFDLVRDEAMIHDWVNRPYALRYWQLEGERSRVRATYFAIQRSGEGHSFIGLLNGAPICQFDVYRVLADELQQFIPAPTPQDCGFHLLMAPNERPIPGLSVTVTKMMLHHYFSFSESGCMYAEPDVANERSNRILQKVGFRFIQSIQLSYKQAHLYVITRDDYQKTIHND